MTCPRHSPEQNAPPQEQLPVEAHPAPEWEMEALLHLLPELPEECRERRRAESRLMALVEPHLAQVAAAVSREWDGFPRQDLVQEGHLVVLAELRARGFRPGAAGAGRSAFPAWAKKLALQAMMRAASKGRSAVYVTDHGRKALLRAKKKARAEGTPVADALAAQGVEAATAHALGDGTVHAALPVEELLGLADSPDGRERSVQHGLAMVALYALPRLQRLAVSATVGVGQPGGRPMSERTLAMEWRVPVREVQRLRELGLRRLRRALGRLPCP